MDTAGSVHGLDCACETSEEYKRRLQELFKAWEQFSASNTPVDYAFTLSDFTNQMFHFQSITQEMWDHGNSGFLSAQEVYDSSPELQGILEQATKSVTVKRIRPAQKDEC